MSRPILLLIIPGHKIKNKKKYAGISNPVAPEIRLRQPQKRWTKYCLVCEKNPRMTYSKMTMVWQAQHLAFHGMPSKSSKTSSKLSAGFSSSEQSPSSPPPKMSEKSV